MSSVVLHILFCNGTMKSELVVTLGDVTVKAGNQADDIVMVLENVMKEKTNWPDEQKKKKPTIQSLAIPGTSNIHEDYTPGRVQKIRPGTRQIIFLSKENSEMVSRLLKQPQEHSATVTTD